MVLNVRHAFEIGGARIKCVVFGGINTTRALVLVQEVHWRLLFRIRRCLMEKFVQETRMVEAQVLRCLHQEWDYIVYMEGIGENMTNRYPYCIITNKI